MSNDGNRSPASNEGQSTGSAEATSGKREADGVREGPGRGNQRSDRNADGGNVSGYRAKAKTPLEAAGAMRMCETMATETVLAEMLEFPPDVKSLQRQVETTDSENLI